MGRRSKIKEGLPGRETILPCGMDPARYPCAECLSPNPWVRSGECFSLRQGQYPLPILLILVSPLTVPAVSCCCRRLPPFFQRCHPASSAHPARNRPLPSVAALVLSAWLDPLNGPGLLAERAAAFLAARKKPGLYPDVRLFTVRFLKRAPCARRANPTTRLADPLPGHPARTSCPPYDPSASWPNGLPALCIQARVHDARLEAGWIDEIAESFVGIFDFFCRNFPTRASYPIGCAGKSWQP